MIPAFVHHRRGLFLYVATGRKRWKKETRKACEIPESERSFQWLIVTDTEFNEQGQGLPKKGVSSVHVCADCDRITDMEEMDTHWTTGKKTCRECLVGSNLNDELASLDVNDVIPIGGAESSGTICHNPRYTSVNGRIPPKGAAE